MSTGVMDQSFAMEIGFFLLYRHYTGCSCCNIGVIRKSLSGYLTSTSGTYSHTGVHNDQASYFNMKLLVFVELGHMQFF